MKSKKFFDDMLALPQTPHEFVMKLVSWGTNEAHKGDTLVIDQDALSFMKDWSLSFYNDSCLVAVMRECVVIGSYTPFNGRPYVVLDELLLTYPDHKQLYCKEVDSFLGHVYLTCME